MTTVQFDSQKIEQLLKAATSERQRKMYQALLDKARKQERSSTKNKQPQTILSIEKTAQTTTKSSTETQKKTKTVKKNQKVATQSTTTEVSTTTKQSSKKVTESNSIPSAPVTSETITSTSPTTEPAPQTEPQSQSKKKKKKKKKKKQQPTVKSPIFQALGTMIATPYFQDEQSYIKINDTEYDLLYVYGKHRQAYIKLKEELEKNGSSPMFLRVYPRASFDYKTQQSRLAFSLVNFSRDCEKINDCPQGFMLRGIWQYIPHSKTPVITIYRNHEQKAYFKTLSKTQQLAFAQLRHLPVVWDSPVEPFKYNPEAEKEAQMPRYFVEVRAIFKDGLFIVEEMLSEPTQKIPKLIKISTPRLDKLGEPQRPSRSKSSN